MPVSVRSGALGVLASVEEPMSRTDPAGLPRRVAVEDFTNCHSPCTIFGTKQTWRMIATKSASDSMRTLALSLSGARSRSAKWSNPSPS